MENLIDGRCGWAGNDALYVKYHDEEWGKEVTDDRTLFEFLILESAQAGLSWLTILRKREGYRRAFKDFDVEAVASMDAEDVERLMSDVGIVRNRRKIETAISNACSFIEVQREYGSFYNYIRSFFTDDCPIVNNFTSLSDIPVSTELSVAISSDMRKRGFKFFGPAICYAYLQATGFVNDHLDGCASRNGGMH